ncbi:helix-turn-helix domain-containing protein [Bradyrhizobium genomosp. I (2014)]|uniref:helix-turn-helix domain-containing protein n=1 Tax=Bradyrhizobium genomosp. I (2014) TaxID=2683269 RepID=UPI0012F8D6C5|nr:helix-turn-helix domain-containing protein [Bradyrhizobium sp. CCBAU 43298]
MTFQPNDILLAFKHIAMSELLNGTQKQFAVFLIDSFNRKTGRCDPSEETAAHILKCSTRTIIRAGNRLVEAKLFRKRKHAGNRHCNSYEPNWEAFRELERQYKLRRKKWAARFEQPNLSPSQCHPCHSQHDNLGSSTCQFGHSQPDSGVIQTSSINPIEGKGPTNHITSTLPTGARNEHLPRWNRSKLGDEGRACDASLPYSGQRMNSAGAAAEASATRRWNNDLLNEFRSAPTWAVIVDAVDLPMQEAATAAELKQGGGGRSYIVEELLARGVLRRV